MNSPSVGNNVEKLELLCIVGGNVKWCSHCGNGLVVPYQVKTWGLPW